MARPTKPKDIKPKAGEGEAEGKEASKGGGGGLDIKFIVTIVAIFLCSTLASVASIYFVAPMVLVPAITAQLPKSGEEGKTPPGKEGEAPPEEHKSSGLNLELDEFTVNLKTDPDEGSSNQFLRAKMALTIKVPEEEDCNHPKEKAEGIPPPPSTHKVLISLKNLSPQSVSLGNLLAQNTPQQDKRLHPQGKLLGAASPIPQPKEADRLIANEGAPAGPEACLAKFKTHMGQFIPAVRDIINTALMKRTATQLSNTEGTEALKDEIKDQVNQILGEEYKVIRVNFQDFIIQR
jgi:flagellar basal body-associated protein FliL